MSNSHAEATVAALNAVDGALAKPPPRHEAKWNGPKLTKEVAWAMGLHAAELEADANNGRLDRESYPSDWSRWVKNRVCCGLPSPLPNSEVVGFCRQFRNGWQSQRAGLLDEHIGQQLSDAMHYLCIDDGQAERIVEEFTKRVKIDEWFVGAGE